MSKRPEFLKQGDKLAIIAPAGRIDEYKVLFAKKILEEWGFEVEIGKHCFSDFHRYAATDEERADDLQYYINDTSVKAIFCARGGYGCIRTLQYIDFSSIQESPKWLVGYSDITVLHAYLNNILQIETIHGSMPVNFSNAFPESLESLRKSLIGEVFEYNFSSHPLNILGMAEGELIGGNLATILSISASDYDIIPENKILFIEDVGEQYYAIDRMMMNLKISGKLSKLNGVIVGQFTNCFAGVPAYGRTIYEIIREHCPNVPSAFGFDAGHSEPNMALYLGRAVQLEVKMEGCKLIFE